MPEKWRRKDLDSIDKELITGDRAGGANPTWWETEEFIQLGQGQHLMITFIPHGKH